MREIETLLLEQGISLEEIETPNIITEAVEQDTLEDFAEWVRNRDCVKRLAFRIGNTVEQ